jgi:PPOX class probable F420-dependent enzyme
MLVLLSAYVLPTLDAYNGFDKIINRRKIMEEAKLAQFKGKKYLNLETFRKNGQGVPTPVWFAEHQDVLYVRTEEGSGKVKRLRNNGRARVAPCNVGGDVLGEWVDSRASLVTDKAMTEQVNHLFNRKYGFTKTVFELTTLLRKTKWTTIAIELS